MQPTRSRFAPARRSLLALASAVGLSLLVPGTSHAADAAQPGKKIKVLYLTQSMGFKHQPVTRKGAELASSEVAFIDYGKTSGLFDVEPTQDARVITPEKLKEIDVLAFYTTGALPISAENWAAVQEWIGSGKGGFIGIHSATDTGWAYTGKGMDYATFINGQFHQHPWNQGTPIKVATHEPTHPTVKMWGPSFDYKEEIYQYRNYDPKAVRVLQSLDFEGTPLKRPYHVPLAWVRAVGKGRLFYTNLGHTPSTWQDPRFREHLIEAVKWVTHQTDGPAEPNPEAQAVWTIHSFVAYGPDGKGQPADSPNKASAVAAKLQGQDKAWLTETAERITKLRGQAPAEPRRPNRADEARDPAKYAEAVAKYEKEKADYDAAQAKFEEARKALLADVLKKAGQGASASTR